MRELASDKDVNINFQEGPDGLPPLLLLCRSNQSESLYTALAILLKNVNINLKVTNQIGHSALSLLCKHYPLEKLDDCVKLLIKHGIDVDSENPQGRNAFMLLCECFKGSNIVAIGNTILAKMLNLKTANLSVSVLRERGFTNEADQLAICLRSRRSAVDLLKE